MAIIPDPIRGVRAHLIAAAAVTSVVGDRVGAFGDAAGSDAAALPYITLRDITGRDERHLGGDAGVSGATVQVDCVGETSVSAESVRIAALGVWRAFLRGEVDLGSGDVFRIDSVAIEGIDSRQSRPTPGHSRPRFIRSFELELMYRTG